VYKLSLNAIFKSQGCCRYFIPTQPSPVPNLVVQFVLVLRENCCAMRNLFGVLLPCYFLCKLRNSLSVCSYLLCKLRNCLSVCSYLLCKFRNSLSVCSYLLCKLRNNLSVCIHNILSLYKFSHVPLRDCVQYFS
jgi:hypothetical protein